MPLCCGRLASCAAGDGALPQQVAAGVHSFLKLHSWGAKRSF